MTELHRDRDLASSFGAEAARYDRTRPTYPSALIDWMGESGLGNALDVGCGTGQVARLLLAKGWNVRGVESDVRMAGVAIAHGVKVDVSTFEAWDGLPGSFDLVCSGQAWHWIDPEVGYAKAAALLRPGGRLVVFWNRYRYEPAVAAAIAQCVGRHAPDVAADSVFFGTVADNRAAIEAEDLARCRAAGLGEPEVRVFEHARTQTLDEWFDEAPSHSQILRLPERVRWAMFAELSEVIEEASGDTVHVTYSTPATSAMKP
jgi:SAM-dependent methyltransferase